MKRCFHWGPHDSLKYDRKYIQIMIANNWLFSKEPLKGTLMKLVHGNMFPTGVFTLVRFEIQTGHQKRTNLA